MRSPELSTPWGSRAGDLESKVLDLLDSLNADGLTLITVTHDPAVARRAHRVLLLEDGRIVRRMPGSELTTLYEALGRAPAKT